ncbi:MAG: phage gp6-like head-tail connector protein [Ruminococcaceae bacterium]|nr:phage gp6-like head-tail connector protein [Oscillospiraceae bacterium]
MTDSEKRTELATSILPDTDTDEVLNAMLADAGALILNRMYPFGYKEGVTVPPRYERIQIQLAVELYTHRGAEGQTSHSENGISRSWPEESALLKKIIPNCGSVISNA